MTSKTTQRQECKKGLGPLPALLALFADADAAAELFRGIGWTSSLTCPECKEGSVTKHCKYKDSIRWLEHRLPSLDFHKYSTEAFSAGPPDRSARRTGVFRA